MVTVRRSQEAHVHRSPIVVTREVRTEVHHQFVRRGKELTCYRRRWIRLRDVGEHWTVIRHHDDPATVLTVLDQVGYALIGDVLGCAVTSRHEQNARILLKCG
ncbi:hypothetical protein D3C87_1195020 [compost metagenome]